MLLAARHAAGQVDSPVACPPTSELARRLLDVPAEQRLFDGRLRIVNVFREQATALLDSTAGDSLVVAHWSTTVFRAHEAFWRAYVGDSAAVAAMATRLLPYRATILCDRLPRLLAVGLQARFERHARWLVRETSLAPVGTWYLVHGHGATDMGGLGAVGMVIDFSNQVADSAALERLLTHELAHQVHALRTDPLGETVLGRIVAEGLATYIACVHAAGARTAADCIGYSDAEWAWARRHEGRLRRVVRPMLHSRARAALDSVASRSVHPLAGGPSAVGYFLGYRLMQSYTRRHGARSWTHVLRMPVAEVLARSGDAF
ncbi:MAG: DUF2268 domain-containing protein [Gemmatimonadaceae bacterium]|nr:DUF2268 domain-containing protein [Gemmatimonadaceae bacterium]